MKVSSLMLGMCGALAWSLASAQSVDVSAAEALAKKSGCMKCHSVSAKKEGPSFKETAAKYKGKADAEKTLFTHLTTNPKIKVDGKEELHDSPEDQERSRDQERRPVHPVALRHGRDRRWWTNLRQRCQTCSRVTLGAGVLLAHDRRRRRAARRRRAGLAWTNTEQFCIGCHEMRDNVYAEFKGTIHDRNRSGVRAMCADCHVPREPVPMIMRKVEASLEVWGHLTGKIDTKEKFEQAPLRAREARVDAHEAERLAGVPQLPQRRRDGARRSRPRRRARATPRRRPKAPPASIATSASRTRSPTAPARRS